MRLAILFLMLGAAICAADTITDPFHQAQNNCNESTTAPYTSCDVIGDEMKFDIQQASVSISGSTASVSLYFNTGAVNTSTNPLSFRSFNVAGYNLIVGDLFFYNPTATYDPSDPNTDKNLKYAIPLMGRSGFTAGDLYKIDGTTIQIEDAISALNGGSDYYRRNEAVLMTSSSNSPGNAATGTESIANYGNGTSSALYKVTLNFNTTADFRALIVNNQIGILFSSADCGNDVIQAAVGTGVPEPHTIILFGAGFCLLGILRRRRE